MKKVFALAGVPSKLKDISYSERPGVVFDVAGWKPRQGASREQKGACEMIREHQPRQKN